MARRFTYVQLAVLAIMAVMLLPWGFLCAYSVLLGGVVSIVPTMVFARNIFRYRGARFARKITQKIYLGEMLKLVSSIVLFSFVFMVFTIVPLLFFTTYVVMQMLGWFTPLLLRKGRYFNASV